MTDYTEKYEKKIEELRRELGKKEKVSQILNKIAVDMQWDCLKRIEDESEQGYHYEEPTEEDYYYNTFLAYKEVLETLEKHFFGK